MTYSIGITGTPADNPTQPASLVIDDASGATPGDQTNAMMLNTQFLCRGPDGGQAWYTYDAERSIPGVRRVLKRVAP